MENLALPSRQLTKRGIELKVRQLVELVEDGDVDPIQCYIQLSAMRRVVDETMKGIKQEAIELVDRVEKWDREWAGVWLQIRRGSIKFDFHEDPEWEELNETVTNLETKLKVAKKQRKKREDQLKKMYFDDKTGEIIGGVTLIEIGSPQLVVRFKEE